MIFFVLGSIIIIFVMPMVRCFHRKEFYWRIIVGLAITHKFVKKYSQSMGITVKTKILVSWNMKV